MKKITVPSASESIVRRREKRKRESSQKERKVEDVVAAPTGQPSIAGVGSSKTVVLDNETEVLNFSIFASMSTYSDTASLSKVANSFLFPVGESLLNQMGAVVAADWGVSCAFQAFTSSVHFRRLISLQEKTIQDLSKSNSNLRLPKKLSKKVNNV